MPHIKPLIELSQLSHETDELAKITHEVYALTTPFSWRYEGRKNRLYFSESLRELLEWPSFEEEWVTLEDYYSRFIQDSDRERIAKEAKLNNINGIDGAIYYYNLLTTSGKIIPVKAVSWIMNNNDFKLGYLVPLNN